MAIKNKKNKSTEPFGINVIGASHNEKRVTRTGTTITAYLEPGQLFKLEVFTKENCEYFLWSMDTNGNRVDIFDEGMCGILHTECSPVEEGIMKDIWQGPSWSKFRFQFKDTPVLTKLGREIGLSNTFYMDLYQEKPKKVYRGSAIGRGVELADVKKTEFVDYIEEDDMPDFKRGQLHKYRIILKSTQELSWEE